MSENFHNLLHDSAADNGNAPRVRGEQASPQAEKFGPSVDGASPVQQAVLIKDTDEERTGSPSIIKKDCSAVSSMSKNNSVEVETGEDEELDKRCHEGHSTEPMGSSTEVVAVSNINGEMCDACHRKKREDRTSEVEPDRVGKSCSQPKNAMTNDSPINMMAESDGGPDRACGDRHSIKRKDTASEVGSKVDEEGKMGDNERRSAKTKDCATEVGYKNHTESNRACNAGEIRKRKGRSSEHEFGEDNKGANASDGEVPLTTKGKHGEYEGLPRDATAIRGDSTTLPGDSKGGS